MSEIYERLKNCIVESAGIDADEIEPNKFLIDDLGIDSIDMMDLIYTVEQEFGVTFKMSEFERIAKGDLGDKPFAVNNVVTDEGLEVLKRMMPEVPPEKIKPGLITQKIPYLFTVKSLENSIIRKLKEKNG